MSTVWTLVESFDVDDGSIDCLSPQLCFVLGAEWEGFFTKLKAGGAFTMPIHSNNAARLVALAERHKRFVEHHEYCNGWTRITVGDLRD